MSFHRKAWAAFCGTSIGAKAGIFGGGALILGSAVFGSPELTMWILGIVLFVLVFAVIALGERPGRARVVGTLVLCGGIALISLFG